MNTADFLLNATGAHAVDGDARPAFVWGTGDVYTYGNLKAQAADIVAQLRALAVRPGRCVGILAVNSPFWAACYLAILKSGAVAVPLSTTITPDELRARIARAEIAALCADVRTLAKFADAVPSTIRVITNEPIATSQRWPGDISDGQDDDLDRDAALMFTSGTTARARPVRITHRNIQANTTSILGYIDIQPFDRMLLLLPLHYCYGTSLLHTYLRAGASLVFCNSFAFPEVVLNTLATTGCTGFAGVPSMFQTLLRNSTFPSRRLPALRHIQQAGGKLPEPLLRELIESTSRAAPNARIFVMYGQTEATARLSYLPPDLLLSKLGSIGKGIPGMTLRVLDGVGQPVRPGSGDVGEIVATGASVGAGYLGDAEASAKKFVDGALHTGDLATVDADGFIYIVDRASDFIKSYGHRVSSQEVESCALEIPGVVVAAAVGEGDDVRGEAIRLFLALRDGISLTGKDVVSHFVKRLPRHMHPRDVVFVPWMPLNGNGKVDKSALKGGQGSASHVATGHVTSHATSRVAKGRGMRPCVE